MRAAAAHSENEHIGEPMRRKLAGFARTLRDNGFKIGLAETNDALAILAGPLATRSLSLKPALRSLFCATHSDWERFDEIFDAYWHNRGVRQARTLSGAALASRAPARQPARAAQTVLRALATDRATRRRLRRPLARSAYRAPPRQDRAPPRTRQRRRASVRTHAGRRRCASP